MPELVKYHRVDWSDFKVWLRDAVINNKAPEFLKINRSSFLEHARGSGSWRGYTSGQLERWLTSGYKTDSIRGLGDFIPPIRDKRKLIFSEEGDEFHLDLALSGSDNFWSYQTTRESIPGAALEAGIMFSAITPATTVNAYNAWLCKCAYSLESSGVDCQITLDFPSHQLANDSALWHNIVRVKRENEASDFLSWSAMMSPAALRNFGFALGDIHCEKEGKRISGTFGRGVPERKQWRVDYNAERRTVEITNKYSSPEPFPAEDMTRQMRAALKAMQGKLS